MGVSYSKNLQQISNYEEPSSLLSFLDENLLENIFSYLVYSYQYAPCEEFEANYTFLYNFRGKSLAPTAKQKYQQIFKLLLNFTTTCKEFLQISKQNLFPLMLNNISINLNYKIFLKILFIKQRVEEDDWYRLKNINKLFYETCRFGYFDIVDTLLDYGANINIELQGQWTPLIETAYHGNPKTAKILIQKKELDINHQDMYQTTALVSASYFGHEEVVKLLLSRADINVNLIDHLGKTPLITAKQQNHKEIVKLFEDYQKFN